MSSEIDMTDTTPTTGDGPASSDVPFVTRSLGAPSISEQRAEPSFADAPPSVNKRVKEISKTPAAAGSILPFLISTIVHTLLLIVLALLTYQDRSAEKRFLSAERGRLTEIVQLKTIQTETAPTKDSTEATDEQPVSVRFEKTEISTIPSPVVRDEVGADLDPAELPDVARGSSGGPQSRLQRLPSLHSEGGLSSRTPERRAELGRMYGATGSSEQAVERALAYLAAHQRSDGSWSFNLKLDPCNGRCRHSTIGGESPAPSTAATGLALLAFLGAGHTHTGNSEYAQTVRRGIYYLRDVAAATDAGFDWQKGSMYAHGIALMALSEALSMTANEGSEKESDLYEMVREGARFSCIAQHIDGSWGYYPQSPGDTTVTGWQVLSLIAARRAGADLQTMTLADAKSFLLTTCTDRDYWFGYKSPPGEPTTTAIGLTLMLYLGESIDYSPFETALARMAHRGPMLDNIYHDYYATLALHHVRYRDWDTWNETLRDHLVATQETKGHEKGSWHFPDKYGDVGGRLYTTAMCALTLEVYYRYLPLYAPIEDFPL